MESVDLNLNIAPGFVDVQNKLGELLHRNCIVTLKITPNKDSGSSLEILGHEERTTTLRLYQSKRKPPYDIQIFGGILSADHIMMIFEDLYGLKRISCKQSEDSTFWDFQYEKLHPSQRLCLPDYIEHLGVLD